MFALTLILCVLIAVALPACFSLRVMIRYYGGVADVRIKYLFFRLYSNKAKKAEKVKSVKREPIKETRKTRQKRPEPDAAAVKSGEAEPDADGGGEEQTERKLNKINESLDRAIEAKEKFSALLSDRKLKKIFKKALKAVLLDGLTLDFSVCGADACQAAINYGKVNAATFNAISAVRQFFPVSVKSVDIACDFDGKKSRFDGGVDVKLRLPALISAGFLALFWYFENKEIFAEAK
jgi:hypothetical protein